MVQAKRPDSYSKTKWFIMEGISLYLGQLFALTVINIMLCTLCLVKLLGFKVSNYILLIFALCLAGVIIYISYTRMEPFMSTTDAMITLGVLIGCNLIISLFKKPKKN